MITALIRFSAAWRQRLDGMELQGRSGSMYSPKNSAKKAMLKQVCNSWV